MARIIVEKDLEIPMRDGCVLKGDLIRPDSPEKLPLLLNRTPYNKAFLPIAYSTLDPLRAAQAGYNVMLQDCRGRYASEGTFTCFVDEPRDGYDTIEWAARQPWCNGKVGTWGASYMGATQWLAATTAPPSLKAMAPVITASDYHDGWTYQGGAFELFFNLSWSSSFLAPDRLMRERGSNPQAGEELGAVIAAIDHLRERAEFLPLKRLSLLRLGAPYFFDWLEHPNYDDFWRAINIEEHHSKITVPALNVGGWYDIFQRGTLRNYLGMKRLGATAAARENQRLLMAPWAHEGMAGLVGEVDFGFKAGSLAMDLDGIQLRFFDRWLKDIDNGVDRDTPVRLFMMGINEWREEKDWPIPGTEFRRYYLHSRGHANGDSSNGELATAIPEHEPPDMFLYDPRNPVPTQGGGLCCYRPAVRGGALDQSAIEQRADVLVYSTPPLAEDLEVAGPIELTLYASSSAPDTDFTAKLVDVSPCGFARNLTDGILRTRFRESRSNPSLMVPGKVHEFTIDMWSTANVFKAGHRIRIEISSSNFPRFDRNPNTGHEPFVDDELRPAIQTVMHERGLASYVTLPVIPRRE